MGRPTTTPNTSRSETSRVFREYYSEMSKNTKECLTWLEDEIDDDYAAHWVGNTV